MRSRSFTVIMFLIPACIYVASAQRWEVMEPAQIAIVGKRDILPSQFITYRVEPEVLHQILLTAPDELTHSFEESSTLLSVGLADGTIDVFRMVEYSMMESGLKAKFPEIKTYRGVSTTNKYRTIRADWTSNGFRAVIREPDGKTYIDPFQRNDLQNCIAYYKKDLLPTGNWTCDVESVSGEAINPNRRTFGDCTFRSYRLAQAANGEYSNFFGATSVAHVAIVMSEVVTAINRVNEVYEADVSVRMILVANTDTLFFYNPSTDPYTNGNGSTMLGQNQTTCDNRIGSSNYDIGHVFSTGGGGVAYLHALCNNNIKAGGVTGQASPVGDPFYIDYVAHEIGHQFGGNHTQNNSCNRNAATAMEPGSASTIMGYAGICAPNVQNNSDDYFHGINLQEITNHIIGTNCDVVISTANSPPVVANLLNYSIPISTPFVLTASATDPENNPMTYCWEQWDQEVGTMPPVHTSTLGPMFRSLLPAPSPSRYFYNLPDLTNNVNPTWEELPSVGRTMEFKVVVRDFYNSLYGCTDEDNTIVTTVASSGPFTVTSQNSGATWQEGSNQLITWNVANTTASPVSCANVDIRLSYDGGLTYPTLLIANETNDGSATISVPAGVTSEARIMVKASANIFFDINNQDIIIEEGLPNFTIELNPVEVSECNDGTVETTVNIGSFMDFADPVALSLLNPPPGAIVAFVPQIVLPGNSSSLTITNLNGLLGSYTPTVRGTSTTGNKDAIFTINLLGPPTVGPTLQSPVNNATNVLMTPLLDWASISGATQYELQISTDDAFTDIELNAIVSTDQYQVTSGLYALSQYFWRIRAVNICGIGPWSTAFAFTTSSCFALLSSDVPVAIPASGTPTVFSTFTTPISLDITDLNIISLIGTHSWVDDLQFFLTSPASTEVLFWNRPCNNNHANFNINFDDEAGNQPHPCPPTNGGTYKPDNPLTSFDGDNSAGTWTLRIMDLFNQYGGSLNSWGLKVCGTHPCELVVTETGGSGPGTLPGALNCASTGDTIVLSSSLSGQIINVGSSPMVINKNLTILSQAPDINITGSGLRPLEISSGMAVELNGMLITAGTSLTGGAINNLGKLTLKNVTVEKNASVSGASLINNAGGVLTLDGNCLIQQ